MSSSEICSPLSQAPTVADPPEFQLLSCPDCSYKTNSGRKLGRHRSVNHAGTKYRCHECPFITGYQSNFYRHRKKAHGSSSLSGSNFISSVTPPVAPTAADAEGAASLLSMAAASYHPLLAANTLLLNAAFPNAGLLGLNPSGLLNPASSSIFGPAFAAAGLNLLRNNFGGQPPYYPQARLAADLLADDAGSSAGRRSSDESGSTPLDVERSSDDGATSRDGHRSLMCDYACSYDCDFYTDSPRDFLHHLRDCHREDFPIHYCNSCSFASRLPLEVMRHKAHVHGCSDLELPPRQTPFSDSPRLKIDIDPDNLEQIISAALPAPTTEPDCVSPDAIYRCADCKYTTSDAGRFKKHTRCHQPSGPTVCSSCDFSTVYSWNLDRHIRCHQSPGRFTCFRCSFSQNTRQSMSFHIQHHHHVITEDCAAQTDNSDWPEDGSENHVTIGAEPFIFEKHAVRLNEEFAEQTTRICRAEEIAGDRSASAPQSDAIRRQPTLDELAGVTGAQEPRPGNKYMPENDVIETPQEPQDLKEYEADPDVKNRTCSICGYQGKWISEMVRHKRVHTNERPFKCKYCSRTSKWKADLIRHVAKVHGVRVVSKYSRSRSFEVDMVQKIQLASSANPKSSPAKTFVPPEAELPASEPEKTVDPFVTVKAEADSPGLEQMDQKAENTSITPYRKRPLVQPKTLKRGLRHNGLLTVSKRPPVENGHSHGQSASKIIIEKYVRLLTTESGETYLRCRICPYTTRDMHTFRAHTQKHENKKPYQCSTCGYRSNWSSDVHKHIRLKKVGHESAYVIRLHTDEISGRSGQNSPTSSSDKSSCGSFRGPRPAHAAALVWECVHCGYQQESRSEVIDHLSRSHNLPAYACKHCNFSSMYRKTCVYHTQSLHSPLNGDIVENLTSYYKKATDLNGQECSSSSVTPSPESVTDTAVNLSTSRGNDYDLPLKKRRRLADVIVEPPSVYACSQCPFEAPSELELANHRSGHVTPVDPFSYKCAFCSYFARKKSTLLPHMKLHTADAEAFMPLVEQNLVSAVTSGTLGHLEPAALKGAVPSGQLEPATPPKSSSAFVAVQRTPEAEPEGYPLDECGAVNLVLKPQVKRSEVTAPTSHAESVRLGFKDFTDAFPEFGAIIEGMEEGKGQTEDYSQSQDRSHWIGRNLDQSEFELVTKQKVPVSQADSTQAEETGASSEAHDLAIGSLPAEESDSRSTPGVAMSITGTKPKKYACADCPARFADRSQLQRHAAFHGAALKFRCHLCSYAVPFPINLTKHLKAHHLVDQTVNSEGLITQNGAHKAP